MIDTRARIRVMVVDDHTVVREGIAALVGMQPDLEVVAQAGDGASALALHRKHQPDVCLMDLNLPDRSGAEVIAALRGYDPRARFVVLTTYEGEEDVYAALRAGAQAYLLKGVPPDELMQVIRDVHAGRRRVSADLASIAIGRLPESELTPRERQVLELIAQGKSNRDIAAALALTESTVKKHINGLLEKLGASGRTEALVTAVRRGLVKM